MRLSCRVAIAILALVVLIPTSPAAELTLEARSLDEAGRRGQKAVKAGARVRGIEGLRLRYVSPRASRITAYLLTPRLELRAFPPGETSLRALPAGGSLRLPAGGDYAAVRLFAGEHRVLVVATTADVDESGVRRLVEARLPRLLRGGIEEQGLTIEVLGFEHDPVLAVAPAATQSAAAPEARRRVSVVAPLAVEASMRVDEPAPTAPAPAPHEPVPGGAVASTLDKVFPREPDTVAQPAPGPVPPAPAGGVGDGETAALPGFIAGLFGLSGESGPDADTPGTAPPATGGTPTSGATPPPPPSPPPSQAARIAATPVVVATAARPAIVAPTAPDAPTRAVGGSAVPVRPSTPVTVAASPLADPRGAAVGTDRVVRARPVAEPERTTVAVRSSAAAVSAGAVPPTSRPGVSPGTTAVAAGEVRVRASQAPPSAPAEIISRPSPSASPAIAAVTRPLASTPPAARATAIVAVESPAAVSATVVVAEPPAARAAAVVASESPAPASAAVVVSESPGAGTAADVAPEPPAAAAAPDSRESPAATAVAAAPPAPTPEPAPTARTVRSVSAPSPSTPPSPGISTAPVPATKDEGALRLALAAPPAARAGAARRAPPRTVDPGNPEGVLAGIGGRIAAFVGTAAAPAASPPAGFRRIDADGRRGVAVTLPGGRLVAPEALVRDARALWAEDDRGARRPVTVVRRDASLGVAVLAVDGGGRIVATTATRPGMAVTSVPVAGDGAGRGALVVTGRPRIDPSPGGDAEVIPLRPAGERPVPGTFLVDRRGALAGMVVRAEGEVLALSARSLTRFAGTDP